MTEGGIPQPISFVRDIKPYLSNLKEAHNILCRIAAGEPVVVQLNVNVDLNTFNSIAKTIEKHGVKIDLMY